MAISASCLLAQPTMYYPNSGDDWVTFPIQYASSGVVYMTQKNDIEFSENLAKLLNGYITHLKSYNGYNTVVNHGKLSLILKYLHNNPLKTKKFISYKRWLKVYLLVKNKKHFTPEGLVIIKSLIKTINN